MSRGLRPAIEFVRDADVGFRGADKRLEMRKRAFSTSKSVKKGVFMPENMQKREKSPLSFETVAKTTIRIDRFMSQALGQPGTQANKTTGKLTTCSRSAFREKEKR